MILRLLVLLLTFVSLFGSSLAGLRNITIDDSNSNADIKFTPEDAWTPGNSGNVSWHESHYDPKSDSNAPIATLFFNGSAVYVYCIIVNGTFSNMSFHIDATFVGRPFVQLSSTASATSEKQIVFSNTDLSMNQQHSLVIQNGDPSAQSVSDLFLDSIIVTYQDEPTSNSKPQVGVIVGSVLGSLALIPVFGLGYLLYIRRRQKSADTEPPSQNQNTQKRPSRWKLLTLPSIKAPSLSLRSNGRPVRTHQAAGSFQIDSSSRGHTGPPAPKHMSQNPPASPWVVEATQSLNRLQRWQQETHEATRDVETAPPDMSEELSSYYDDNATESQRYRPGTPPPPPRRFIVRNN